MIEGDSYHSIYLNSPKIWNWTKTHGGPYYVEVGKNIKHEYMEKENVTVVLNATSNLTETTEQNVVKTWTYYDYEQSSVEYYYYKDCIIKDM